MNKYWKTSLVLLSSIFVLAACGQNNSAQTTQAAQETTQANNKQSKLNPATNNQSQEKQKTINRTRKSLTSKIIQIQNNKAVATFQKTVKLSIN